LVYNEWSGAVISNQTPSQQGAVSQAVFTPAYFRYWGKAGAEAGGAVLFHLLPFHCLDVAAVGQALLAANAPLARHLSRLTGLDGPLLRQWMPFFLALHDLGKFADAFQNLRPDLLQRLQGRRSGRAYGERHDTLGYLLWREHLKGVCQGLGVLPASSGSARRRAAAGGVDFWLRAVTGHHGQPPKGTPILLRDHFEEPGDLQAATAFVTDLNALLLEDAGQLPALDTASMERASWWLAGLTVLCDWLGSSREPHTYVQMPQALSDYWPKSLDWARGVVERVGLPPPESVTQFKLADCLPGKPTAAVTPTPLQAAVEAIALGEGPQLFILEDVTGAGKTEAALLLAHRLMRNGQGEGLYFGLPTMATSNAMYERLGGVYRRLFSADSHPSLVLAHSARALSDAFRMARVDEPDYGDHTQPAGAHCNAWLADNRKKALLADAGVGTVDQALLAVLPARHQSLRLLGLLGKVLIVDEVHACDAYMNELLCGLLRAHASAGGSAILLSATLPAVQRRTLIESFAQGTGGVMAAPVEETGNEIYPLLTQFTGLGVVRQPVATPERVRRRVGVEALESEQAVCDQIVRAAEAGRCVCWIRNTVADARNAWQSLRDRLPEKALELFHARFAMDDRLAIEKRVVESFGPTSGPHQRRGRVLVATQVVEQSLDLDFDLLVSDLAPVDLIIQRAGRLCRHPRDKDGRRVDGPDERGEPLLCLLAPPWTDEPHARWLRDTLPGTAAVYRDQDGLLWQSLHLLREKGGFRMPEDARELIEGVYGEEALAAVPDALQAATLAGEGARLAEGGQAQLNLLKIDRGYQREESNIWWDEAVTPTRLGEPTITLYLARWQDGHLVPWKGEGVIGWMRSAVSVRQALVKEAGNYSDIPDATIKAARESLPAKGRWGVLLPLLEREGGLWQAWAKNGRGEEVALYYDPRTGLTTEREMQVPKEE